MSKHDLLGNLVQPALFTFRSVESDCFVCGGICQCLICALALPGAELAATFSDFFDHRQKLKATPLANSRFRFVPLVPVMSIQTIITFLHSDFPFSVCQSPLGIHHQEKEQFAYPRTPTNIR